MRITIDNQDGRGPVDYTSAVVMEAPLTVRRALNAPSRCTAEILSGAAGLATPVRRGRVVVTSEAGTILFTGFIATEPVPLYAGTSTRGSQYRVRLTAVSDEWILDKQGSGASETTDGTLLGQTSAGLLGQLAQTTQGTVETGLTLESSGNLRASGAFAVTPAATWSNNAAAAANATYAAYRVLNGTVSVVPAGATTHVLNEADGTLNLAELSTTQLRELANDVTVSGAEEASTYVQEIFQGDGTTTDFELSHAVFRGTNRTLLKDSFAEANLDTTQWMLMDGADHIQLTSAGLTVAGGNGFDGQTKVAANNPVEMSGAVLAEAHGVLLGAASDGMLLGFYNGPETTPTCFAGFRVRQSVSTTGSVTVLAPLVNGTEQGTIYTPLAGHSYTLRLRLYCTEMQRIPQRYYCMVDGVVQQFGSIDAVDAPMHLVFEIVDEGVSSNTPATVLYDSVAASSPVTVTVGMCSFVAVNSTNLYCSIASMAVSRSGSLWAISTLPNGAKVTRLTGVAGQGVDCEVSYGTAAGSSGKLTFFTGRVPVAGERITVRYRVEQRSVARLADQASITTEQVAGSGISVPGVSRWLGRVTSPVARSSEDCEAAAQAILAMSTARSEAVGGSCLLLSPAQDIWPGDLLEIVEGSSTISVLVRSVDVKDCHALPELCEYRVHFANDWATEWADGLGLKLSEQIASDAILPQVAKAEPADVLATLQQLDVVSLTGAAVQVDAGVNAPTGGGFEVRRRAEGFGVGVDNGDLVLRSPVRSFSIPRAAQVERYFVRMYDASTPPVYSRFSSALYLNWPLD